MIEFRTSKIALERVRQRFKLIRTFIQVMFIGLAIFLSYMNLTLLNLQYGFSPIDLFIWLIPFCIVIAAFVLPKFQQRPLKNLEAQRVRLLPQGIERSAANGTEHLKYHDVHELQVHRNSSDEVLAITLSAKQQNMHLDSLEHMDALLEGLRAVLPDVPETEKRHRISMQNNRNFFLVMLASGVIGGAIVLALLRLSPNQNVTDLLQALIFAVPALFVLLRKPTSNSLQSAKAARQQGFASLFMGLSLLAVVIWQIFF